MQCPYTKNHIITELTLAWSSLTLMWFCISRSYHVLPGWPHKAIDTFFVTSYDIRAVTLHTTERIFVLFDSFSY